MADKKISQLTGASTPLAGTEVLPVVQGGSTVKVSVADLTAGRSISTAGASLDGSVVINDSGAAVNFRVEGDTDANLIFAEASTDRVGFGVSNPSYKVTASSAIDTYTIGIRDTIGNDRLVIGPRTSAPIDNITPVQIANDNDGNLLLSSRTNNPSGVKIYRNAGTAAVLSANFDSAGNVTVSNGNLIVGTAGKSIQDSSNVDRVSVASSATVVNESGADIDFRVEGDTNANMIFVDASADSVGIGTSSLAAWARTTVDGQMSATNAFRYYTASKSISTGATTDVFSITLPSDHSFAIVQYEIRCELGSPQGQGAITSGRIALSKLLYGANAAATVTQDGISGGASGGITSVQVSGTTAPSGRTVTFSVSVSSFVPSFNENCSVFLWSRSTDLTVAAV